MTSAVVVGSGPNGMAAALTLADAGVDVRVVEAADRLGGGMRSSELTAPGLIHDECSAMHPFALASVVDRRFDLAGAGLTWRWAPVELAHPQPDGSGAAVWRSVEDTATALGEGGRSWARLFGPLAERFPVIAEEFLQPMLHVPRHPLQLARFGVPSLMPATVLARALDGDAARALFMGVAAHAFHPLDRPLSAPIGLALTTAAHAFGWPVAEGGSGAITAAMQRRCDERGVRFETGRTVASLSELDADVVMLDTTPGAVVRMAGDALPARVRRSFLAFRHGPGAFKVDYAVEGEVPWRHEDSRRSGTVHLGGDAREVAALEDAVWRGRMPERPFVLVGQQHLADPTRSAGGLNPLYAYAHVPAGYQGDATEAITARIEEFAPGFRERIRAVHVRTTTELSRYNANFVAGDITTGANTARQLVFRPRLTTHPYDTGISGVYLCSAATPPGAGAHGVCGHLAARRALGVLAR